MICDNKGNPPKNGPFNSENYFHFRGLFLLKGALHHKVYFVSNLIFWVEMGWGKGCLAGRGPKHRYNWPGVSNQFDPVPQGAVPPDTYATLTQGLRGTSGYQMILTYSPTPHYPTPFLPKIWGLVEDPFMSSLNAIYTLWAKKFWNCMKCVLCAGWPNSNRWLDLFRWSKSSSSFHAFFLFSRSFLGTFPFHSRFLSHFSRTSVDQPFWRFSYIMKRNPGRCWGNFDYQMCNITTR